MATPKETDPTDWWAVVGVVMVVTVLSSRSSSVRSAVVDGARRLSLDMSAFISLLVDFDLGGEWAFDNSPSCAHWVADRADIELCTVREGSGSVTATP